MQIKIDEIVVHKRVRGDLGDLTKLAVSMKKLGQLNPILLTPKRELIAGQRRLEAAKKLGWQTIEANLVSRSDVIDRLELEIDENVQRKDFTPEELHQAYKQLEKLQHPSWIVKAWRAIVGFFKNLFRKF